MPHRVLIFVFLFFCHSYDARPAAYIYDYTDNCDRAYQNYMSLHLAEGRAYIVNEMKANPYNLMATYLSDYEDCILLLMNCDREDYEQRAAHLDERVELLEKGDHSSPWYRFCKAGIYLHWALVNTRFGEQYKAALNFHRSFALLKDNKRLFPGFEYNVVFGGLQEAVVGSLPGNYKWVASIFGMKGSVKKGTEQLTAFVNTHNADQPLYLETLLYYTLTRFYLLSQQKEVWDFLNSPQFPTHNNLLNTFAKVNIALDYHKSAEAAETLQDAAKNAGYDKYPVFDYQMGIALFCGLDTGCNDYFRQYLRKNRSDLFVKDAWQKMGLSYYLNNNISRATYCMSHVKTQGNTRLDPDKQAERFAEAGVWPSKQLLQARLLIEGGYYSRALGMLKNIDEGQLPPADKLEYLYRLGRACQEAGDNDKSLEYYQATINKGKSRHEQFASRAALQMGQVYEHRGMMTKAVAKYKECLDMPAHDFQNSIDQQAKAGINRLTADSSR